MVSHTSDKHLYEVTVRTESTVSDQVLVKLWTSWSVIFALSGTVSFMVWIAILLTTKTRRSSFNQYLLFLMFPDWFFTFNCAMTCAMNAANGSYWSFAMCQWQSWYCMWGIGANAWINGFLARQIHVMLKSTTFAQHKRLYQPPTTAAVIRQSTFCYVLCAIFASLGIMEIHFYPVDTSVNAGITCYPRSFTQEQHLFMWLFIMPMFVLLPYLYVLYAVADIWWRKLVPTRGKRRLLTIYFFRIVGVFLLFWGPLAFFFYLFNELWVPDDKEIVVVYILAAMAHLQAAVSAIMAMTKPDIWASTFAFWTCQYYRSIRRKDNTQQEESSTPQSFVGHRSAGRTSSRFLPSIRVISDNKECFNNNNNGNTHASVVETWQDIPVMNDDGQFPDENVLPTTSVVVAQDEEQDSNESHTAAVASSIEP